MRKTVQIELVFRESDRVREHPPGVFRGGVQAPAIGPTFSFNISAEERNSEGESHPGPGYSGFLQINLMGTGADFREIGRYFLGVAELDTRADPDFHEHHDELISDDGRTHVHLIVRKHPS